MKDFRGDLAWIHKWEGHAGKPYWPRGNSGVTLDPGVDLGHADLSLVTRCYSGLVTAEQWQDLQQVMGLRGGEAGAALDRAVKGQSPLAGIRISREQAVALMKVTAAPYWQQISSRFTVLADSATPTTVQTALLSLAYNRGPGNKALGVLAQPLAAGIWRSVGERIQTMQQDHALEGVRRRRRSEGALILSQCSPQQADQNQPLAGFRGDFSWIHAWEGHVGRPYWPKGKSGITLDPGVDLGYAEPSLITTHYTPLLTAAQMKDLQWVFGRKGEAAEQALAQAEREQTPLTSIRISRDQADSLFALVAAPYWKAILKRFPTLGEQSTPATVQTAFLSLAYNRGAGNKDLTKLDGPLRAGQWRQLGELIAAMQQDHALAGIRRRRRSEGQLILDSLEQGHV